jgi:hypothetical protein
MRALTAIATPAAPSPMVCLDSWAGSMLGVQVVPSGGAQFTIDYSFDNPNDLINPVPAGSMAFDSSMVPAGAVGGAASVSFQIPAAPIWGRLRLLNGLGQVRAVFLQPGKRAYPPAVSGAPPVVTSVWSPSDAAANGMTLTNGGLTVTPSGFVGNQAIRGSISHNTGRYYVEFLTTVAAVNGNMMFGMADTTFNAADQYPGSNGISFGFQLAGATYQTAGFTAHFTPTATPNANDVFAFAVDFDAGAVWMALNNVWYGEGNPTVGIGVNPTMTMSAAPALGATLFPALGFYGTGQGVWTLQPTAASQKYAPPTGFSRWG